MPSQGLWGWSVDEEPFQRLDQSIFVLDLVEVFVDFARNEERADIASSTDKRVFVEISLVTATN